MTRTISPLTSPRKRRASSAEGAAGDFLVHLGHLAADGGRAVRGDRGQRRQRLPDPTRRLEGDHGLGRAQHALHLARALGQEALEAPAVGRQAGGDQRDRHHRGPRQHGDVEVALDAAADQLVAGVGDRRACRRRRRARRCRRARSAAPARSPAGLRCPRGWRSAAAPGGCRACRADRRCGACPRRRCSRRRRALRAPARVMSSRLPIGVGQTISSPGISPAPAPARSAPSRRRRSCPRRSQARPRRRGSSSSEAEPVPRAPAVPGRAAGRRRRSRHRR